MITMQSIKTLCCRATYLTIYHSLGQQKTAAACASYKTIIKRNLSQYVKKIRHLQKLKEDGNICKKSLADAQFAVFYGLRPLVQEREGEYKIAWMSRSEIESRLNLDIASQHLALLDCGQLDDTSTRFALSIPPDKSSSTNGDDDRKHQKMVEVAMEAKSMSMRKAMFVTSQSHADILSQGHSYLQWHIKHQYCSKCGGKTLPNAAGNKRECQKCSETYFPLMSPVAITLVTNSNQCLVARQAQFPKGMYSALAGFCETRLEDAVQREVAEEVGLDVESISYCTSQHWPFPSSALMLACYAAIKPGTSTEVSLDVNEIEDARWLHRDEIKDILGIKGGRSPEEPQIWLPPSQAVAHHLLRNWALL